jgi:MFS family permease
MTRELKLISSALFLWGLGETLFYFTQTLYLEELGADPVQIGGFMGLFAAAMTITHLPAGFLADKLGRRPLLIIGWMIGLFAALSMFLADSLTPFVISLVIYGFTGFVISPLSSYITAARGDWSVQRALTTAYAAFNVGGVIGPLLAFSIADHLTLRATYGLATAIFTISTATLFLLRPQPVQPDAGTGRGGALLRNTHFLRFLTIAGVILIGGYLSWPLTPNFLQAERGVPVRAIWLFGALNSMGMTLVSLWLGRLATRQSLVILQIVAATSILFFWQTTSTLWFALAYFLAGGFRTFRSLISAHVETLVRPSNLGLAYGAVETMIGVVALAAPPAAGLLYEQMPALPFIVSLGVLVSILPFSIRMLPRTRVGPVLARSSYEREQIPEEELQ